MERLTGEGRVESMLWSIGLATACGGVAVGSWRAWRGWASGSRGSLTLVASGFGALLSLALGGLAFVVFALGEPIDPETVRTAYGSRDGRTLVTLVNEKRVRVGGETNIWMTVERDGRSGSRHRVDHNGRLRDSQAYLVQVSTDGAWVRTCKPLSRPERGVLRWQEYSHRARSDFARGQWRVEPAEGAEVALDYTFACDTYLRMRDDHLIRAVLRGSTRAQRESRMFAPQVADTRSSEVDGVRITWEPTSSLKGP